MLRFARNSGDGAPGGARGRVGPSLLPAGRAAREAAAPWARAPARVGPAAPAHGPRSPCRALPAAVRARAPPRGGRFKRLAAGARGRGELGGRRREGHGSVPTVARSQLPSAPCHPLGGLLPDGSLLLLSRWGTMVTKAGLGALCGAPRLPDDGSSETSKVYPWNWSVAAAKALVHQKLSPPATCALADVEGMKQTGKLQRKP